MLRIEPQEKRCKQGHEFKFNSPQRNEKRRNNLCRSLLRRLEGKGLIPSEDVNLFIDWKEENLVDVLKLQTLKSNLRPIPSPKIQMLKPVVENEINFAKNANVKVDGKCEWTTWAPRHEFEQWHANKIETSLKRLHLDSPSLQPQWTTTLAFSIDQQDWTVVSTKTRVCSIGPSLQHNKPYSLYIDQRGLVWTAR